MQILRIDSSTTGDQSISRKLVTRDLVAEPLAHIDPITTKAIRTAPDTHEEAVAAAYPDQRAVLEEFLASDIVIVGAPMYNFTIPSQLKARSPRRARRHVPIFGSRTGRLGGRAQGRDRIGAWRRIFQRSDGGKP